ncbi:hypothetical protein Emag_006233 [Eimeria magna]
MWGEPFRPPGGQDIEILPTEGADRAALREFAPSYSRPRTRCGSKVTTALAALLAVAAVVFVVLHCEVRRVEKTRTSGLRERRLASRDEEDEVETSVQGSPKVCEGLAGAGEQQVQEAQGVVTRPRRRRARVPATSGNAGGPQARARKTPGKSGEALKILFQMAKGSAQFSESSHSSKETSPSPTSSSSAQETPESEEEPLIKKKKSKELAEKSSQVAKPKTSAPEAALSIHALCSEELVNAGERSRGGPGGEDDFNIPASLLELYLQDTLHAAEESSIADWLIDPEADLPLSITLSEEKEAHFAALQMGAEAGPPLGSLEGSSLMTEQAPISVTGQEQHDGVAGASGLLVSSSDQPPEVAAMSLAEAAPTAAVRKLNILFSLCSDRTFAFSRNEKTQLAATSHFS